MNRTDIVIKLLEKSLLTRFEVAQIESTGLIELNFSFTDSSMLADLAMDIAGVPSDNFNTETGEGYCRDFLGQEWWDLGESIVGGRTFNIDEESKLEIANFANRLFNEGVNGVSAG